VLHAVQDLPVFSHSYNTAPKRSPGQKEAAFTVRQPIHLALVCKNAE